MFGGMVNHFYNAGMKMGKARRRGKRNQFLTTSWFGIINPSVALLESQNYLAACKPVML